MRTWSLAVVCGAALGVWSCGPAASPTLTCEKNRPSLTLKDNLQPDVFDAICKACHNSGDPSLPNYSDATKTAEVIGKLSRYAGTTAKLKIVDPGNLHNSAMWLKVSGGDATNQAGPSGERVFGKMPAAGELTDAQIQALKDWICGGAK